MTPVRNSRGFASLLLDALFIVPDSQVHILDVSYQRYAFDLFHKSALARVSHWVALPIALACLYAALLRYGVAHWLLAAVLLLHVTLAVRIRLLALIPPLVAVQGVIWSFATRLLYPLQSASGLHPAALVAACTLVQYLGHLGEPLPPPWSVGRRFTPIMEFFRTVPAWRAALILSCAPVHYLLECVSAPRNLFLGIQIAGEHLGVRNPETDRIRARIQQMVAVDEPVLTREDFHHALGVGTAVGAPVGAWGQS